MTLQHVCDGSVLYASFLRRKGGPAKAKKGDEGELCCDITRINVDAAALESIRKDYAEFKKSLEAYYQNCLSESKLGVYEKTINTMRVYKPGEAGVRLTMSLLI